MKGDHYFKLRKLQIRMTVFQFNKDWQNLNKIIKYKINYKIKNNKLYNKKNKFKNNKKFKKIKKL